MKRVSDDADTIEAGPDAAAALVACSWQPPRRAIDPFALLRYPGDWQLFSHAGGVLVARDLAMRIPLPGGLADAAGRAKAMAALGAVTAVPAPVPAPVPAAGAPLAPAPSTGTRPPVTPPIAIAALPFDPHAPTALVVPRVLFDFTGTTTGAPALTCSVVAPRADLAGEVARVEGLLSRVERERARLDLPPSTAATTTGTPSPSPSGPTTGPGGPDGVVEDSPWPADDVAVVDVTKPADFVAAVRQIVDRIASGDLVKVVLAFAVDVRATTGRHVADVPTLLGRLRARDPSAPLFAIDGLVGASPELLVARSGAEVVSHPLAGTAAGDKAPLLARSGKDLDEHRLVADDVVRRLEALCKEVHAPTAPSVVERAGIAHLGTLVRGVLADDPLRRPSVLDLLAALHPTPAVGGVPRDRALDVIRSLEAVDRGWFAGPVGWTDAEGDGEWMINIRSAAIGGGTARVFAGAGIVAGSDPIAELAEIRLKLRTMLDALGAPAERGA